MAADAPDGATDGMPDGIPMEGAFPRLLGITQVERQPNYAKLTLTLDEMHLNRLGIAHGGILFSLMDTASGIAAGLGAEGSARGTVVTLSMTINYIRAVRSGRVVAESRVRGGRRTLTIESECRDAEGALLATALGTFQTLPAKA